jgi:hypothetical protein
MRDAVERAALSGLEAARVLAAPASAVRHAVLRAVSSSLVLRAAALSGLEAALLLASLAPSVRLAVRRAASLSSLEAALVLAPPATSVRDAVLRIASCRLGTVLLLAPFAASMSLAVRSAAGLSPLGAALQLTLPPAHDTPPGSSFGAAAETILCTPSQPPPTPSQPSTLR